VIDRGPGRDVEDDRLVDCEIVRAYLGP
jgi:hypothetical protein